MRGLVIFLAGLVIGLILMNTKGSKPTCNVIEKSDRSFLLDKKRECTDAERAATLEPKP